MYKMNSAEIGYIVAGGGGLHWHDAHGIFICKIELNTLQVLT